MNDTQLGNWMRSLPRATASPAFTSEVLRRARGTAEGRRGPLVWRMAAGFAMAACLAIVAQLVVLEQAQQRKAALRAEQQQLQAELQAVKQRAADAEPVVVLENDRGTRVVMDFDSAIQPVSHRTYD